MVISLPGADEKLESFFRALTGNPYSVVTTLRLELEHPTVPPELLIKRTEAASGLSKDRSSQRSRKTS